MKRGNQLPGGLKGRPWLGTIKWAWKPKQPAPIHPSSRFSLNRSPALLQKKLLVRMPTRSRPAQALDVLSRYRELAGVDLALEVVIDDDDASMHTLEVQAELRRLGCTITSGPHKSKVEAVNGGRVNEWDVLLLASDDMVPLVRDYGKRVLEEMGHHFPHLDGALYFSDGYANERLCTLPVFGRRLYDQFKYVYFNGYKSFYCDNEQTEVLQAMGRLKYIPGMIIEHRHFVTGKSQNDALYQANQAPWNADRALYEARKRRRFDAPQTMLSILIATMPQRATMLNKLLDHLWTQVLRHPRKVEIIVDDDEKSTTGAKRQRLLGRARGEFVSSIDDDDWVSDRYVDNILEAINKVPTADCVEFHVEMIEDRTRHKAHCSTKYTEWSTINGVFARCPNHISPVRRTLALRAGFPDKTIKEDFDYSMRLRPLLKTEAPMGPEPMYFYYPGRGRRGQPKR